MFGNQQPQDPVEAMMNSMSDEEAEEIMGGFDIFVETFDISYDGEKLVQEFSFEVNEDVDKDMEEIVELVKDDIAAQRDADEVPDHMDTDENFEIDGDTINVTLTFDGMESEEAKFMAFQTLIMDQVGEQPQQVAAFVQQALKPNLAPRLIASLKLENRDSDDAPDYIG